ncbi:hypothetical protein Tco_0618011 [Tanacetum coccineum]
MPTTGGSGRVTRMEARDNNKTKSVWCLEHTRMDQATRRMVLPNESLMIPLEELRVDDKLHFVEERVEVMDREIKQLKRSRIPIIKVRWNSKRGPEFTWE